MTKHQLEVLQADTAALVAAYRTGPTTAPIAACPGWDLAKLVGHVVGVHRIVATAVRTSAAPDRSKIAPATPGLEADELEAGLPNLLEALASRSGDDPVWNWSKAPQVAAFWPRRVANETAVHRWDAQRALGAADPIGAGQAVDAIDELFDVFVPMRLSGRDDIEIGGSVHLHCTDAEGEWTFDTATGAFRLERGHAKGDCAVRGPASDLLLMLWGRQGVATEGLTVFGDQSVIERWLALGASA